MTDMNEYIESGILELYVFGALTEKENLEVQKMANAHSEVQAEILSIEQAVINLSYSASPHLSLENYERIRQKLIEKHAADSGTIPITKSNNSSSYIGWAAAVLLLMGLVFQYYRYNEATQEVQQVSAQRSKYEQLVAGLQKTNAETQRTLNVLRSKTTRAVELAGQQASPQSFARIYLNNNSNETYVDVSGLPEPPKGKVYQVWALKLTPLTPVSIGIVDDLSANHGIIKVENYQGAQAFGITLEPTGGSASPTMEQLYALGKV